MSRIVLLAAEGASTNMVYHALARKFGQFEVIIENPVPRSELLKRRLKRLGFLTVIGQVLFMLLIEKPMRKSATARFREINQQFGLNDAPIQQSVHRVPSVNSDEARSLLKKLNPKIVVLNGTRILSQETLAAVPAKFINMHVGITPAYRGVHGGYWALVNRQAELAGTTIHFVDKGIDTGKVIKQTTFQPTPKDSFVTYPILQVAAGLPLLVQTVRELMTENWSIQEPLSTLSSKLYSHPTLWGYIANRLLTGVK